MRKIIAAALSAILVAGPVQAQPYGPQSGPPTTVTLGPGLTSTPGTQNTGTQTITNGSSLAIQNIPKPETANYSISTATGCPDTGVVVGANGSGSITFTLPNPGATCGLLGQAYSFTDFTGHGYGLATTSGTANFVGIGASATTFTVPAYGSVYCSSDGSSKWSCQGGSLASSGSGCVPASSQYQVLLDSGSGGCTDVSGLGTSTQVLTSNGSGAAPSWQAGGGGGSSPWTRITSATATGGSAIILTGLSTVSYNVVDIRCYGVFLSAQVVLSALLGEGAGPTWKSSGYNWMQYYIDTGFSAASNGPGETSLWVSQLNFGNSATLAGSFSFQLYDLPSSTLIKSANMNITGWTSGSSGRYYSYTGGGNYTGDTNPITAFELVPASGTITGTCYADGAN